MFLLTESSAIRDVQSQHPLLPPLVRPNVGVRRQMSFVAMNDLSAGAELTIDYAMIDGDHGMLVWRAGVPGISLQNRLQHGPSAASSARYRVRLA